MRCTRCRRTSFFTSVGDYFILAPSGSSSPPSSTSPQRRDRALAGDALFRDYRAKSGGDFDLGVYMKKEFFDEIEVYNMERRQGFAGSKTPMKAGRGDGALKTMRRRKPRRASFRRRIFSFWNICLGIKSADRNAAVRVASP
jgi:hypothetical protein